MSAKEIFGYVDGIRNNVLYGWCVESSNPSKILEVDIHIDGHLVQTVTASNFRQDIVDAGYGTGYHSFFLDINDILSEHYLNHKYNQVKLSIFVKGYNIELTNSPIIVETFPQIATEEGESKNKINSIYDQTRPNQFESSFLKSSARPRVLICGGVPCSDVGGGQRSAQLARAFKARSWEVIYTYMYPAVDTTSGEILDPGTPHYVIYQNVFSYMDPHSWLNFLQKGDIIIVEIPHENYISLMEIAKTYGITTVYEIIDDWESSLGGEWYKLGANRKAAELASLYTYTARNLELSDFKNSSYEPNAVDLDIFDAYKTYECPADIPNNGNTNFLYFGSLYGEWFWWEALLKAADNNKNANFIMIGHPPADAPSRNNIYYLGGKQNEELPSYLNACDYAICPFKPIKISDAVSPVKVFEYLAMHKPTVASGVVDTKGYPGLFFANTIDEFSQECGRLSLKNTRLPRKIDFDIFAVKNSWQSRIESILINIEELELPVSWGRLSKDISDEENPIYSVIILCRNNREVIWRCLASLAKFFSRSEMEIIVVDNSSTDASNEVIECFENVILIRNDKNGCSSGRNIGIKAARGKYISFLDSDQYICGRSWLTDAKTILDSYPSVGVVGWAAGWFSETLDAGPIAEYMPLKGRNGTYDKMGFRTDIGYLGTGGMVMKESVVKSVGYFDEFYDPTCFEDTDWSLRIKDKGLLLGYFRSPTLLHQAHQTTSAGNNDNDYKYLFERNQKYIKEKFGNKIHLWTPLWK